MKLYQPMLFWSAIAIVKDLFGCLGVWCSCPKRQERKWPRICLARSGSVSCDFIHSSSLSRARSHVVCASTHGQETTWTVVSSSAPHLQHRLWVHSCQSFIIRPTGAWRVACFPNHRHMPLGCSLRAFLEAFQLMLSHCSSLMSSFFFQYALILSVLISS